MEIMKNAGILKVKYLGTSLLTAGLIGISGYGSTIGTGPEAKVTKQVEDLIKNKKWKSVKIKWNGSGGDGGQNSDGWDFALVKANENGSNDAAKEYCEGRGFTAPVNADWATVYKNLGWNVETKQETTENKKETKICI